MSIITWFCVAVMVFTSVMTLVKAVRARTVAGKARIIKVCVPPAALIVQLIGAAVFVFFGIGRLSAAQDYFRAADKYEATIDRLDGIFGGNYQQAAMKTETLSSSESSTEIRKKIASYRQIGEANKTYATILFIIAASDLVLIASTVWYITEEGILMPRFKIPEPFFAKQNGGKIELHFMAQFKNETKVITFKSTPKNLAVFGRFMVWEQEQNPQIPQLPQ